MAVERVEMNMDANVDMGEILRKAALATADLAQPVRVFPGETGGFVFQTNKGENMPADMTERSEEDARRFFEEICSFVDEQMGTADNEDEIPVDFLTAPEWFGPYRYMDAFYCLRDLSLQLDPNRARTLLDPVREHHRVWEGDADDADGEPVGRFAELEAVLERKCSMGSSCVYRFLFPHVDDTAAGPVAISPVVLSLLTRGVSMAAVNESSLTGLLEAVSTVLLPDGRRRRRREKADCAPFDAFSQPSVPSSSSCINADLCICCLFAKQTRSYVDASTEVAIHKDCENLLAATTFLGVMDTVSAKEGRRKNEVDFFAPIVNVHDRDRCYLADRSPFAEYRIEKKPTGNGTGYVWVVIRDERPTCERGNFADAMTGSGGGGGGCGDSSSGTISGSSSSSSGR